MKTVSGDMMPRENPSVARRDLAAKMILEMSRMFGLSQVDRFNISKIARGAGLQGDLVRSFRATRRASRRARTG